MSQRLKRWESPRREERNDKGRGGSARQRQKQKQMKALRQRLKSNEPKPIEKPPKGDRAKPQKASGREIKSLPFFCAASSSSRQLDRISCRTSCDFPRGKKAVDQAFSA